MTTETNLQERMHKRAVPVYLETLAFKPKPMRKKTRAKIRSPLNRILLRVLNLHNNTWWWRSSKSSSFNNNKCNSNSSNSNNLCSTSRCWPPWHLSSSSTCKLKCSTSSSSSSNIKLRYCSSNNNNSYNNKSWPKKIQMLRHQRRRQQTRLPHRQQIRLEAKLRKAITPRMLHKIKYRLHKRRWLSSTNRPNKKTCHNMVKIWIHFYSSSKWFKICNTGNLITCTINSTKGIRTNATRMLRLKPNLRPSSKNLSTTKSRSSSNKCWSTACTISRSLSPKNKRSRSYMPNYNNLLQIWLVKFKTSMRLWCFPSNN